MDDKKRKEIELAWKLHKGDEPLWQSKKELRDSLAERQNNRCCFCYCRFEDYGEKRATIEHVLPKALGGKDEDINLVASCFSCNSARGDILYWPLARDYSSSYYRVYDDEDLKDERS